MFNIFIFYSICSLYDTIWDQTLFVISATFQQPPTNLGRRPALQAWPEHHCCIWELLFWLRPSENMKNMKSDFCPDLTIVAHLTYFWPAGASTSSPGWSICLDLFYSQLLAIFLDQLRAKFCCFFDFALTWSKGLLFPEARVWPFPIENAWSRLLGIILP